MNAKLYLRDVLQRFAVESDVKRLLPHGWKQHYEAEVVGRRHERLGIAGEQPRLSRGTRVKDPLGQAAVGVKRRLLPSSMECRTPGPAPDRRSTRWAHRTGTLKPTGRVLEGHATPPLNSRYGRKLWLVN